MTGDRRIDVRALHKPLMDAGIVPKNCRLMSMNVGTSGALVVVYEVLITVDQLATLGRVFETVSDAIKQDGDGRRAPVQPDDEPEP